MGISWPGGRRFSGYCQEIQKMLSRWMILSNILGCSRTSLPSYQSTTRWISSSVRGGITADPSRSTRSWERAWGRVVNGLSYNLISLTYSDLRNRYTQFSNWVGKFLLDLSYLVEYVLNYFQIGTIDPVMDFPDTFQILPIFKLINVKFFL